MSFNTGGFGGFSSDMVAADKVILVGTDVNNDPAAVVDPFGRLTSSMTLSPTQGNYTLPEGYPEVKVVDNAADHHGGTFTIGVANQFVVNAAGGGINMTSNGNISLMAMGGAVNIDGAAQSSLASKLVVVNGTDMVNVQSHFLNLDCHAIHCKNMTYFYTNAYCAGSMGVAGELYVSHITGPLKKYETDAYPEVALHFDSGVKIEGTAIIEDFMSTGPYMPSKAVVTISSFKPSSTMINTMMSKIAPHKHNYHNLPIDFKSSIDEVWEEAGAMADATEALQAKPALTEEEAAAEIQSKLVEMASQVGSYIGSAIKGFFGG